MDNKQFGISVGFYNRVNGTNFTVKQALSIPALVRFAEIMECEAMNTVQQPDSTPPPSVSTKRRSLDTTNTCQKDYEMLELVVANPDLSRAQLEVLSHRTSGAVCASLNRLVNQGRVFVAGEKKDIFTRKMVNIYRSFEIKCSEN